MSNFITKTDQYKANSHWNFLSNHIKSVLAYCEARTGAKHPILTWNGLQGILKKDFVGQVITEEKIEAADRIFRLSNFHDNYFDKQTWYRMLKKHNGRLPIRIKALPEGTRVPVGNALFTVEGLDDEFPALSQRCESRLLHAWYPTTIATKSAVNLRIIKKYFAESSDLDPETARHLYIDFGYRACSGDEQAAIGGTAHLINCYGSDTVVALEHIDKYYGGLSDEIGATAYSIPATEHTISQSYGLDEDKYLMDCITKYPNWLVSIVADTNNIEKFIDVVIRNRKREILKRWESGKAPINKIIPRPDSLRFTKDTPLDQIRWIFNKLEDIFGVATNKKGKKVIHPCISTLWGDGIEDQEIEPLYKGISDAGYSVESLAIGQGGGLLVKDANRDTERFALKASSQKHSDQQWHDVIKDPLDKSKKSKAGQLKVIDSEDDNTLITINQHDRRFFSFPDELETVFEMGEMTKEYNFMEIRKRGQY